MTPEQSIAMFCTRVGFAFRMERLSQGMSVEELADKVEGMTPNLIRKLERGEWANASMGRLAVIAHHLDVDIHVGMVRRNVEGEVE
jgi:transcriptional regulator with XRE-family HTH domain